MPGSHEPPTAVRCANRAGPRGPRTFIEGAPPAWREGDVTEKMAAQGRGSVPLADIIDHPERLDGLDLSTLADLRRQYARLAADLDYAVTLQAAQAQVVAEPDRLLDVSEVGERLNLEVRYVYELIR